MEFQSLSSRRYSGIDLLRAAAILLMVAFHLTYDLREFAGVNVDYRAPFWLMVGKMSGFLFIFVSGLCCGLSRAPARRGLKVFLLGLLVTAVTYLTVKEEYVRFGILHFLGVAMILSPLFLKLPSRVLVLLAAVIAALGFWFRTLLATTFLLLPLGLMYPGFDTIDYYPLFPYLGISILGILAYRYFYAEGKTFSGSSYRNRLENLPAPKLAQWLSRNSLRIYLVHQPIFLAIIYLLNQLRK